MDYQTHEVSLTELAAFTGKSNYPEIWARYRNGKSKYAGFNIWAFIFGTTWFVYRKLYLQGILFFIIELAPLLLIVTSGGLSHGAVYSGPIFFLFARLMAGFLANALLYRRALSVIKKTDTLGLNNEMHLKVISAAGGVSIPSVLAMGIVIGLLRVAISSIYT